jgi:queuosine precursor transporter
MMTRYRSLGLSAVVFYVTAIYLANLLTARLGLVPVGFGLVATAGTYMAGWAFVARNLVQETLGRKLVLAAIVLGAALSWFLASHKLAVASGATFLVSETIDFLVYTPIRARAKASRGWALAALAGNVCGATVDTFLFLTLAGYPLMIAVPGQMLAKLYATAIYLSFGWLIRRAVFREPEQAVNQ